jgi:hypothetical protein
VVQNLVGLGLAFVELLEAESARLKINVKRVLVTAALVIVGGVVVAATLAAASGFLFWAAYAALLPELGSALSALVVGLGLWIIVGGASWLIANRLRNR